MKLSIIVAAAENNVIGTDNKLPWHLPEDLKYFKAVTMGKPILMGRKTYESIGRPLPGRTNIVITRQSDWSAEGVQVVHTLAEARALAEEVALIDGVDEMVVIGGAEIYAQALPACDQLYLTRVHADVEGDATFPAIDAQEWKIVTQQEHAATGCNPFDYTFIVFARQKG